MAFPVLPLALLGAGIWWYRSRSASRAEEQAPGSDADAAKSADDGKVTIRPMPGVAEFRRRAELDAMLGKKKRGSRTKKSLPTQELRFEDCKDEGIPEDLMAELASAFESKKLTPVDYATIVELMVKSNFSKAAECFRKLGEKRRTEMTAQIQADGGLKYAIQEGDSASSLAKYYTGFPAKFRELGALNEKVLGKLKTVNNVSNYPGWKTGTEILIPADWKPLEKPFQVPGAA